MWEFLFYQSHPEERKQVVILKAGETRISTRNSDTKYRDKMLRIIVTGTAELVENINIYQFPGCY